MCSENKRHTRFLRLGTEEKKDSSDHFLIPCAEIIFWIYWVKQNIFKLISPATRNF